MISKFLIITTLFGVVILSPFSNSVMEYNYNTSSYDHAYRGAYFNPNSMVTQCISVEYLPRYSITNYTYLYGDGTKCLVQVDKAGVVHNILVTKP